MKWYDIFSGEFLIVFNFIFMVYCCVVTVWGIRRAYKEEPKKYKLLFWKYRDYDNLKNLLFALSIIGIAIYFLGAVLFGF